MATKTKSTKTNTKAAESLAQEKEETVEVKQLLKDERTHKIAGSFCILLAILFFIAFTSYLFTWDEDQDKVFRDGYKLLLGTDTRVANLMGTFGAFISHLAIYKGFGVASYLICSLFFVIGINLFFECYSISIDGWSAIPVGRSSGGHVEILSLSNNWKNWCYRIDHRFISCLYHLAL
jgi:DNA segregation ATPase FtsK/SpoIIIE, S-DNA-T family